jgi:4'-phosphopantetheinyl transferase EntD
MADDTQEQAFKMEKDLEDMGVDSEKFESLDKDFQDVLKEIVKDKNLERFRMEFERL